MINYNPGRALWKASSRSVQQPVHQCSKLPDIRLPLKNWKSKISWTDCSCCEDFSTSNDTSQDPTRRSSRLDRNAVEFVALEGTAKVWFHWNRLASSARMAWATEDRRELPSRSLDKQNSGPHGLKAGKWKKSDYSPKFIWDFWTLEQVWVWVRNLRMQYVEICWDVVTLNFNMTWLDEYGCWIRMVTFLKCYLCM